MSHLIDVAKSVERWDLVDAIGEVRSEKLAPFRDVGLKHHVLDRRVHRLWLHGVDRTECQA